VQCVARGGWVSERQHLCGQQSRCGQQFMYSMCSAVVLHVCSKVSEMVAVVFLANRCNLSDHHKPERATKLLSVKWPSFEATRRLQVWVPLQECVHELML
jgi:hypothetical protein